MNPVQQVAAGVALFTGFLGGATGVLLLEFIALALGLPVILIVTLKGIR